MTFEEKLKYYLSDNKATISFVNISDIYVSEDNKLIKILCSLKNEKLNSNLLYIIKGELQYFLAEFNCDVHIGLNNVIYFTEEDLDYYCNFEGMKQFNA